LGTVSARASPAQRSFCDMWLRTIAAPTYSPSPSTPLSMMFGPGLAFAVALLARFCHARPAPTATLVVPLFCSPLLLNLYRLSTRSTAKCACFIAFVAAGYMALRTEPVDSNLLHCFNPLLLLDFQMPSEHCLLRTATNCAAQTSGRSGDGTRSHPSERKEAQRHAPGRGRAA
jgi:hypothetical protein